MKCPNCGAEVGKSNFCEFCGTQISLDMKKEQEQLNKLGCPKCGSSNIRFNRENQGELRGKNAKQIIHRTVGFCQDCGHTWYPESAANERPKKNNMIWWVLGWIFFFPAPVMVLIWRKKNTWDIKVKLAVTVVFWVAIFVIGSINNSSESSTSENTASTTIEQAETKSETQPDTDVSEEIETKSSVTETKEKTETKTEDTKTEETKTEETKTEEVASNGKYSSYEDIYNEYKQKIIDATPGLVEEYNNEAASNNAGLEGLAEICNNKIAVLADISTEGISEMADFMLKNGNGSYSDYEDWSGKLMDVYMDESGKITDAYLESAQ